MYITPDNQPTTKSVLYPLLFFLRTSQLKLQSATGRIVQQPHFLYIKSYHFGINRMIASYNFNEMRNQINWD